MDWYYYTNIPHISHHQSLCELIVYYNEGALLLLDLRQNIYDWSQFVPTGEVCGQPHATIARYGSNRCDDRSISEPDNVISVGGQGTLIIGEDTNENQVDSMCE